MPPSLGFYSFVVFGNEGVWRVEANHRPLHLDLLCDCVRVFGLLGFRRWVLLWQPLVCNFHQRLALFLTETFDLFGSQVSLSDVVVIWDESGFSLGPLFRSDLRVTLVTWSPFGDESEFRLVLWCSG